MEIKILEENDVQGNSPLRVIENFGAQASLTDLAALTGCRASDDVHAADNGFAGMYWLSTPVGFETSCVNNIGKVIWKYSNGDNAGIRPVMALSDLPFEIRENHLSKVDFGNGKMLSCKYGEFPQTVVNDKLKYILDDKLENDDISYTDRIHLFDGEYLCPEYAYNKNKYIRLTVKKHNLGVLSNDERAVTGETYWLKVEPIKWIVDERSDLMVSQKILLSGIKFNIGDYFGNFKDTNLYGYLNDEFYYTAFSDSNVTPNQNNPSKPKSYVCGARGVTLFDFNKDQSPKDLSDYVSFLIDRNLKFKIYHADGKASIFYNMKENYR